MISTAGHDPGDSKLGGGPVWLNINAHSSDRNYNSLTSVFWDIIAYQYRQYNLDSFSSK